MQVLQNPYIGRHIGGQEVSGHLGVRIPDSASENGGSVCPSPANPHEFSNLSGVETDMVICEGLV